MGLSASGLAGLSRGQNRKALIEARTRLFADADDAWNEELPVGKSVSLPGYQAVVVRLSKRLTDMAEDSKSGMEREWHGWSLVSRIIGCHDKVDTSDFAFHGRGDRATDSQRI